MRVKRFVLGCMTGFSLAVALNILPYAWTFDAPGWDGYRIVGFPLVFHRAGGFAYSEQFIARALLMDVAFALLLIPLAGWLATKLRSPDRRGFPLASDARANS